MISRTKIFGVFLLCFIASILFYGCKNGLIGVRIVTDKEINDHYADCYEMIEQNEAWKRGETTVGVYYIDYKMAGCD